MKTMKSIDSMMSSVLKKWQMKNVSFRILLSITLVRAVTKVSSLRSAMAIAIKYRDDNFFLRLVARSNMANLPLNSASQKAAMVFLQKLSKNPKETENPQANKYLQTQKINDLCFTGS